MRKFLLLFLSISLDNISAQNLVPNSSFEDTVNCPTFTNQLNKTQFWINPNQGSPDYFNSCSYQNNNIVNVPNNIFGSQVAQHGNAYAGIYTFNKFFSGSREYLEINLSNPLQIGRKYLVSFFVSLADSMQYSINTIGAYFSPLQISGSGGTLLLQNPQIQNTNSNPLTDKNNWQLIQDTLYPNGGEQYMTIGNFKPDSLSDTLFLGNGKFFSNYSYYYIDSVSVIDAGPLSIDELKRKGRFEVFPNPASDRIELDAGLISGRIEIINIFGERIFEDAFSGRLSLDISTYPNGVYFAVVRNTLGILKSKFIKE
jgi:hypothetical protein